MDSHPSYFVLSPFIAKYPSLSGPLFITYNDLVYGQRWSNVEVVELPLCRRLVIKGSNNDTQVTNIIVPCSLPESLSMEWFSKIFDELGGPNEIYLGIVSDDSSVVYYRLASGIIKPPS